MNDRQALRDFLNHYRAESVALTRDRPADLTIDEADPEEQLNRDIEVPEEQWDPINISEAPARPGEFPERFIDGSVTHQPVLCLRSPPGWPIPMVLGEVGAVGLRLEGRRLVRDFVAIDRVLSWVADPFPWADMERVTAALVNMPELRLRVLPANLPQASHNPFDYAVMQHQAQARLRQEMTNMERLALTADRSRPVCIDGGLNRLMGAPAPESPLMIGVIKSHARNYLHPRGWETYLDLRPRQRTPYFYYEGLRGEHGGMPVITWYLKLGTSPNMPSNVGTVRVEIPAGQFEHQFRSDPQMINRLSGWLIDARCRDNAYARMSTSLEPIVRAEDALKPLFTSFAVLVNRFYRVANLFRGNNNE